MPDTVTVTLDREEAERLRAGGRLETAQRKKISAALDAQEVQPQALEPVGEELPTTHEVEDLLDDLEGEVTNCRGALAEDPGCLDPDRTMAAFEDLDGAAHRFRERLFPQRQPEDERESTEEGPSVVLPEHCRNWIGDERCGKPAEFIVWGKLFDPDALGPRCYDCAAEQIGHNALQHGNPQAYAVYTFPSQPSSRDEEVRERLEELATTLRANAELAGQEAIRLGAEGNFLGESEAKGIEVARKEAADRIDAALTGRENQ